MRTRRRRAVASRAAVPSLVTAFLVAMPVRAQSAYNVPAARCSLPAPAPFAAVAPPAVTVRLVAEGAFPDADAAAARALVVLVRDIITERAPVTVLSRIAVQGRTSASFAAAADPTTVAVGTKLMTVLVKRAGDSVAIAWQLRDGGARGPAASTSRMVTRVDAVGRLAAVLAETAVSTAGGPPGMIGRPSAPLGSVEAGEAWVSGLAEAMSSTPEALVRARARLFHASRLAPRDGDVWRWRATVEEALLATNRDPNAAVANGLRASLIESARKAAQLAPASPGAQLALVDAHLVRGDKAQAEEAWIRQFERDRTSPGALRRAAALNRVSGNDAHALTLLRDAAERSPRDARILTELALVARTRGDLALACHAANAAVAADMESAPAFVLRAVIRFAIGERRQAWADAEVATRLGHPEWGERAAAAFDAAVGDRAGALRRLQPLGGVAARPANLLETLLLANALAAVKRGDDVAKLVASVPCRDLRRGALVRDLGEAAPPGSAACAPSPAPAARGAAVVEKPMTRAWRIKEN